MQNRLTLYLETLGHGFIGLECESCADGKPAEIKAGFYPGASMECKDEIKNDNDLNDRDHKIRKKLQRKMKTALPVISTVNAQSMTNRPKGTILPVAGAAFASRNQEYSLLNEGKVDGKKICDASDDGINFSRHSGYFDKQLEKFYRISYEINAEDSIKVYKRIKYLAENKVDDYQYAFFGHNCLDFTREIYDITSLDKRSFSGIYNFNPIVSLTGLNGVSAAYMGYRDVIEMSYSNPALALGTGLVLFGLYKWSSNKIAQRFGTKFNPESITQSEREQHLASIENAKNTLQATINLLQEPLAITREAHNDYYGDPAKKDEYEKITAVYKSIKELVKTCEETLEKVNELEKNYNSLSNQSLLGDARKVIIGIKQLPAVHEALVESASKLIQEQAESQQTTKSSRRKAKR